MATRERPVDAGTRRGRAAIRALGADLREARIAAGLSQNVVARVAGMSDSNVSRIERGELSNVSILELSRLLAVVGLDLSARAFPGGDPLRDEAHRNLLERLAGACSPHIRWRYEVPLPIAGDRRAWDAVLQLHESWIVVEAETVGRDLQALQRRIGLKRRDDPRVDRLVLAFADTRANRSFVGRNREQLTRDYPLCPAAVLEALEAGREPEGDGYVLI